MKPPGNPRRLFFKFDRKKFYLKLLRAHTGFVVILLLCAVLRLLPLTFYQFTYDELSGLERTQFSSFFDLLARGVKVDAHPALVQLLIFCIVKCFGYVTWIVKLPFVLFSLGAVVYAYAFGIRYFSRHTGLLAAVFFGFSLVFVYYAPIARMYIPGVFFSLGMLYHFFAIFFNGSRKWISYFLLGLFAWLSALNHHMGALFAFTLLAGGLIMLRRFQARLYLTTMFVVLLAYLPHLPITLYQLGVGGIGRDQGGWLEAPPWQSVFSFLGILCGSSYNWIIVILLILFSRLQERKWRLTGKQIFLLSLFIVNYLVIYAYSVMRAPVYQHSVMLFSGVCVALLLCSLMDITRRVSASVVTGFLAFTFIYTTYFRKDYLRQCVTTVYEYQFKRTVDYIGQHGDKNVTALFFDADELMKKIYFKKYRRSFACYISTDSMMAYPPGRFKLSSGLTVSSVRLFSQFIRRLRSQYVVMTSSTPLHEAIVAARFPYLIENTHTQANYFRVYSRKKSDALGVVAGDEPWLMSEFANPGRFKYERDSSAQGMLVSAHSEFPFTCRAPYKDVAGSEGMVMLASAILRDTSHSVQLCISVEDTLANEKLAYSAKNVSDFSEVNGETIVYADQFFGTKHNKSLKNGQLSCYLWNPAHEKISLSGFKIRVIHYWPEKWNFWN
jgi:hypothetical protein